jgi:hypothetical protein
MARVARHAPNSITVRLQVNQSVGTTVIGCVVLQGAAASSAGFPIPLVLVTVTAPNSLTP